MMLLLFVFDGQDATTSLDRMYHRIFKIIIFTAIKIKTKQQQQQQQKKKKTV